MLYMRVYSNQLMGNGFFFLTKANFFFSKKKNYLLDELHGAHNNLQTLLASPCN